MARVRDADKGGLQAMEIEHYPGMTEKAIRGMAEEAVRRWDLGDVRRLWKDEGMDAVRSLLTYDPASEQAPDVHAGPRKVLVHASGFQQSPYADITPAGVSVKYKFSTEV